MRHESALEATDARAFPPPGQMVDVGGHRLHLHCAGSGGPTVVIDAGMGGWSASWGSWVQPDAAKLTRVCTYDRAGMGHSEAGPLPRTTDALVHLMLGGIATGRDVHVLHARLRYLDPERRRAGLPEHVAALVDHMTDEEVGVQLVNLDPVETRTVIVQAGAYAEHELTRVRTEPVPGAARDAENLRAGRGRIWPPEGPQVADAPVDLQVSGSHFAVRLAPSCGMRLVVRMRRFANQPTFAFPWA